MAEMVVSIDPGSAGGVGVFVQGELREVLDFPQRPQLTKRKGGAARYEADPIGMMGLLRTLEERYQFDGVVVSELMHARPGNGSIATFSLGWSRGVIESSAAACEWEYRTVAPHVWKRWAGLTGRDKRASLTVAAQRFPAFAEYFRRVTKDVDRADAVLVGAWWLEASGRWEVRKVDCS